MQPFTRADNWGWWDELDGKKLVEGEKIRLQFPDGTQEVKTIHVQSIEVIRREAVWSHNAWFGGSYHGVGCNVFVMHSELLGERVTDQDLMSVEEAKKELAAHPDWQEAVAAATQNTPADRIEETT